LHILISVSLLLIVIILCLLVVFFITRRRTKQTKQNGLPNDGHKSQILASSFASMHYNVV